MTFNLANPAVRAILLFGLVSFFADITYEGARSITGPFLGSLGASAASVGFIAGVGELLGFGLRYFSGRLADRTRSYWLLMALGYGVNVVAVPLMAYAGSWRAVALLVILERTGKSIRAPARDVMLSAASAKIGSGLGFGVHAFCDQLGAVVGPLFVAWAAVRGESSSYRPAFLWLAVPAVCAMLSLWFAWWSFGAAGEAREESNGEPGRSKFAPEFWIYIAAAGLLAFGFADFALIGYHLSKAHGFAASELPLFYAVAMALNGLLAPVFGRLFDKVGIAVLPASILVAALSLPFSFLGGPALAWAGVACWGIGMAAMDAVLRAGVSGLVSMSKRGTAYGIFNAVYGVAWFLGSALMGWLYTRSVAAAVVFGVAAQLAAAAGFMVFRSRMRSGT